MNIVETPLEGVYVVISEFVSDERGSFSRLYCDQQLSDILGNRVVVQTNISKNINRGCVRGLHFQYPPYSEMKLIRCLRGKVFDIAVDLRTNSETYLKWYATVLTPEKNNMMVIPEGCAHGFQVMMDNTELLYLHTSHYKPSHEGGVRFDDPELSIDWPISQTIVSEKDRQYSLIGVNFKGISL